MIIEKAGIIGLGLIGGSLAKALKMRCGIKETVVFNRSLEPLLLAQKDGMADIITQSVDESFADCDIIFICTPVNRISQYAEKLSHIVKKDCILTDAGSTKHSIMAQVKDIQGINFIGGHPMAGSEKTGYTAAKEHLFENAYYILTPREDVSGDKVQAFKELVQKMGAIPVIIDGKEHDYAVAGISHVPHVIASALVNTVNKIDTNNLMHNLAAGGFKDITRIASSSPEMWSSISFENKQEILNVLTAFENELKEFRCQLEDNSEDQIIDFFTSAKEYRDSFIAGSKSAFMKTYEIIVDIIDKPGSIATVATMLSVNNINIKNIGIINNREYENGVLQILFATFEEMEKGVKLLEDMNFYVHKKS